MSDGKQEALQLLGLARRAGRIAAGTDAVKQAVRQGRAKLVVWATDGSEVQMKKVRSTIHDRTIPELRLADRNALGIAVGSAPLTAVAVTDPSLARRLLEGAGGGCAVGAHVPDEPETRR